MRPGQPSTMRHLYTGMALWCVAIQAAFLVTAILQERAQVLSPRSFQLFAVFVAVLCIAVHSILVIHFIGSMKWIQQSGPTAGVDDTETLRRAWIQGSLFPLLVLAMLIAVAVAILAGASRMSTLPAWAYQSLAALGVLIGVAVIPLARREITANKLRMVGMAERMRARIGAGDVRQEDDVALLPESGLAGGKTLMFLGLNVWLLYAYNRFVLRDRLEPILPYAIACLCCMAIGGGLIKKWRREQG